jgi:hypothetical protein
MLQNKIYSCAISLNFCRELRCYVFPGRISKPNCFTDHSILKSISTSIKNGSKGFIYPLYIGILSHRHSLQFLPLHYYDLGESEDALDQRPFPPLRRMARTASPTSRGVMGMKNWAINRGWKTLSGGQNPWAMLITLRAR